MKGLFRLLGVQQGAAKKKDGSVPSFINISPQEQQKWSLADDPVGELLNSLWEASFPDLDLSQSLCPSSSVSLMVPRTRSGNSPVAREVIGNIFSLLLQPQRTQAMKMIKKVLEACVDNSQNSAFQDVSRSTIVGAFDFLLANVNGAGTLEALAFVIEEFTSILLGCQDLQVCFRSTIPSILVVMRACSRLLPSQQIDGGSYKHQIDAGKTVGILQQILTLLGAIMRGNDANQTTFANCINKQNSSDVQHLNSVLGSSSNFSESLVSVILSFQNPPCGATLALFDMMLEVPATTTATTAAGNAISRYAELELVLIKNVAVIPTMFGLLRHCSLDIQAVIFEGLQRAVTGQCTLANLATLSRCTPGVFDLALDLLPHVCQEIRDKVLVFVESVGRRGLSCPQLKLFFRSLQQQSDDKIGLLGALKSMLQEGLGPKHVFAFEGGKIGGLEIPSSSKWPAPKAWSFAFWFRFDLTFESSIKPICLLSLRSSDMEGFGIELLLCPSPAGSLSSSETKDDNFRVVLKNYSEFGESICDSEALTVNRNKWHFVAISLKASASQTTMSSLSMLVDDNLANKNFPFPKFSSSNKTCSVEGNIGRGRKREQKAQTLLSLRGQISAINFFSRDLSDEQMRELYLNGYNYSAIDGFLSNSVMLAYNPAVWDDALVIDNTPTKNDVPWSEKMHALCHKGTYCLTRRSVLTALDAVGGLHTLLPLFSQVDNPALCLSLIDVFATLLKENLRRKKKDKSDIEIFALVGYCFARIQPNYLTQEVLQVLLELHSHLNDQVQLQDSLVREILCNFKLWSQTSVSVQIMLLEFLSRLVDQHRSQLFAIYSPTKVIETLFFFYGYDNVIESRGDDVTSIESGKPAVDELCRIRDLLWSILKIYGSSIPMNDLKFILQLLVLPASSTQTKIEIVRFLLEMFTATTFAEPNFYVSLIKASVESGLASLINDPNAKLRLSSFLLMCEGLYQFATFASACVDVDDTRDQFLSGLVDEIDQAVNHLQKVDGDAPEIYYKFIASCAQHVLFGRSASHLYVALNEHYDRYGNVTIAATASSDRIEIDFPTELAAEAKIAFPQVLRGILSFANTSFGTPSSVRLRVVFNLKNSLASNYENCRAFVESVPAWHYMLLKASHEEQERISLGIEGAESISTREMINDIILGILSDVVAFCLRCGLPFIPKLETQTQTGKNSEKVEQGLFLLHDVIQLLRSEFASLPQSIGLDLLEQASGIVRDRCSQVNDGESKSVAAALAICLLDFCNEDISWSAECVVRVRAVSLPSLTPAGSTSASLSVQDFRELATASVDEEMRTAVSTQLMAARSPKPDAPLPPPSTSLLPLEIITGRMRDVNRENEAVSRRHYLRLGIIMAELMSERGPWGNFSRHKVGQQQQQQQQEVFWSLSPVQTSRNIPRVLLVRNKEANRHKKASQIQATGTFDDETLVPVSPADVPLWKIPPPRQFLNESGGQLVDGDVSDEEEDPPVGPEMPSNAQSSQVLLRVPVEVVTIATNGAGGRSVGILEITYSSITYTRDDPSLDFDFDNTTGNDEFLWACKTFPPTMWVTSDIHFILKRFYCMEPKAVEVFFLDHTSVFFSFEDASTAKSLFQTIQRRVRPRHFNPAYYGDPHKVLERNLFLNGVGGHKTLTQAWQNREISNFDYLLKLNLISGRSFHDLSQYPVFPWIIADYTSKTLDLRAASTYRDLRYPIKAQHQQQRDAMEEKYNVMHDDYNSDPLSSSPPRHTGSHYSTPGQVIWYLLRVEPFSSLHVWFQNGKIDKPDRLFDSIGAAYDSCTGSNLMDVKELTPEFFCNPEFLESANGVDFGQTQTGRQIGSKVALPPWAKNAHDFVRINREALESDYVSRNLHCWIDLIFGHAQRPPHILGGNAECVKRCNVFCHVAYQNAVDLSALAEQDIILAQATIRQILEFGQVPANLFRERHEQRRTPLDAEGLFWPIASVVLGASTHQPSAAEIQQYDSDMLTLHKPKCIACIDSVQVSSTAVIFVAESDADKLLVTVDWSRIIGLHSFQKKPLDSQPPVVFKVDKRSRLYSEGKNGAALMSLSERIKFAAGMNISLRERVIGIPFASSNSRRSTNSSENSMAIESNEEEFLPADKREIYELELSRRRHRANSDAATGERRRRDSKQKRQLSTTPTSTSTRSAVASPYGRVASTISSKRENEEDSPDAAIIRLQEQQRQQQHWERERSKDHISSQLFAFLAVTPTHRLVFSCGHWDNSFRATLVDSGRHLQSVAFHEDVVTCMALASDVGYHWLLTGSRDCTVVVWRIRPDDLESPVDPAPLFIFHGHDDAVTSVAVSVTFDIVISGSDDGTLIIHSLHQGEYIRSISVGSPPRIVQTPSSTPTPTLSSTSSPLRISTATSVNGQDVMHRVSLICISIEPYFVVYSRDGHMLFSYSINGRLVSALSVGERLYALCVSEDGRVLLTGGARCLLVLRWVISLQLANDGGREGLEAIVDGANAERRLLPFASPIRSLLLTNEEAHLLVGLESGELRVLTQDAEYLRIQLHSRLQRTGFLK